MKINHIPNFTVEENRKIIKLMRKYQVDLYKCFPLLQFKNLVFSDKDDDSKMPRNNFGNIGGIPHYLRLYDLIKSSYLNYKVNINSLFNFFKLIKIS